MRSVADAVLLAVVLLTGVGWIGEGWGQTKIARVGIVAFGLGVTGKQADQWWEPFRRTLAAQGWIEGKTVSYELRTAIPSDPSRFAEVVADLAQLGVDAILATSAPATRAAYTATRTIPIVALDYTNDPVAAGYAESYTHPGGNLTGVFLDAPEFSGKWLELLKAIVPGLSRVTVLWDPTPGAAHLQAVQTLARALPISLQVLEVRKPEEIEKTFSAIRANPQALIILPSPMIYAQSEQFAKFALKRELPATSMAALFARAGGLLSYGPDNGAAYERCALLMAKVLGGSKPGDLPIERPTKYQLIVNLQTAKALGITVPESILVRADEVIR